jgi:general secretion pathway protein I
MWTSWWIGSPAESPSPAEASDQAGFTLLELLVAFAILAVAMAATLQAFGSGLDAARRTDGASEALAAARSQLDRVGTELPIEPGRYSGGEERGTRWSILIERRKSPLDHLAEAERLYALFDVVVTAAVPGSEPVSLATVRVANEQ